MMDRRSFLKRLAGSAALALTPAQIPAMVEALERAIDDPKALPHGITVRKCGRGWYHVTIQGHPMGDGFFTWDLDYPMSENSKIALAVGCSLRMLKNREERQSVNWIDPFRKECRSVPALDFPRWERARLNPAQG